MEAAMPIQLKTPQKEEEIKMIEIKAYNVEIDKKPFKLELAKSSNYSDIIIKITNSNLCGKYYLLILNLENFYELNIVFKLYQNINEIYSFLLDIILNKKYSLVFKDESITLTFEFPIPGGKIININLDIKEKKIRNEEFNEQISNKIKELKEENAILKEKLLNNDNEIKILKDELNKIKNTLKDVKEENIQIKQRLKKIEELFQTKEENKNFFDLNKSNIIEIKEEKAQLYSWISTKGKIKNINLLYKATKDGDDSRIFFKKCSNKGPTFSLIKSKKGKRFGGFSMTEWTDQKGEIRLRDEKAFLFSLDYKQKYDILNPNIAIGCYPYNYSLVYGNACDCCGICLRDNFLSRLDSFEDHHNKAYNVPLDCLLSGEKEFGVEEVEVYQVIFSTLNK